ncbi:MAG: heavy metal-associated domain-containing protein, partial [bacterium]|nr:heavy metal-associated domain-containing protein [bacterium]
MTKVDGVDKAQVNFANGRATVLHDESTDASVLAKEVESLGYAVLSEGSNEQAAAEGDADLRRRLIPAAALTLPLTLISMLHAL